MDSAESFGQRYGVSITSEQLAQLRDIVLQSLEFYEGIQAVEPWTGYLTIESDTNTVVGCCGFKGNPTEEGSVEISYFTFPEHEGKGFATAAAGELVAVARNHEAVQCVLAHTLPERNASCRVLEKTGFENAGEVIDPEDGIVWRWRVSFSH